MADILSNSISGLLSIQQALTTTGHNIANANTEGYSRQSVDMSARPPEYNGNGYLGTGVKVDMIKRNVDNIVESQLRAATSDNSRLSFLKNFGDQVNSILGDTSNGLPQQMQSFFNAAQDVAANPTDLTARSAFLGSAQTLSAQFNRVDGQLQSLNQQVGSRASDIGQQINSYAQQVADLNRKISEAYGQNPQQLPNDLLDQRDLLVRKIADKINIRVTPDGNGSLNIAVGSGQSLVLGSTASKLSVSNSAAGLSVRINNNDITSRVTGGQLAGILDAQNQLINPLRNQLGRAAMVLAQDVNSQQAQGVDLNGQTGTNLFNDLTNSSVFKPSITAAGTNQGSGSATGAITDPTQLTGDSYRARFDGTNWQVTTQPDNGSGAQTIAPGGTLSLPGIDVTFGGSAVSGDVLNIQPTVGAASQLSVVQQDPAKVAAAAAGQPAGSRDNSNINALESLLKSNNVGQSAAGAGDGTSLTGALNVAIGQAGNLISQSDIAAKASDATLKNLQARQQSVSGVNLDEEAANLVKLQQNYQALSRTIAMSNQLFQSVLSAFG